MYGVQEEGLGWGYKFGSWWHTGNILGLTLDKIPLGVGVDTSQIQRQRPGALQSWEIREMKRIPQTQEGVISEEGKKPGTSGILEAKQRKGFEEGKWSHVLKFWWVSAELTTGARWIWDGGSCCWPSQKWVGVEAWLEILQERMREGETNKQKTKLETISPLGNVTSKGTKKWEKS